MNAPRSRARVVCGGVSIALVDLLVGDDALDLTAPLEQVVERPRPGDVVVREVEQRDARVRERQVVLLAVRLDQVVLDDPVDLGRRA